MVRGVLDGRGVCERRPGISSATDESAAIPFMRSETKRKPTYPVIPALREYLLEFKREMDLPLVYEDLLGFRESIPLLDARGNDTLWESVIYDPSEMQRLNRDLTEIYAVLKVDGDLSVMQHLYVDRVDFCTFGNSHPFRIRIVNSYNDNQDYYYVKKADASRVYGLELEHLLSPNRINYLTCGTNLVEEHISGIPGDVFIDEWLHSERLNPVRVAKELVKFNERCFIRLLGDMRSYNFVVDVTPDFEGVQVRIRCMDFDQQSYDGRKNFYLPQFFKDNSPLVLFCQERLNRTTARQYQREEQALIYRRVQISGTRLNRLLAVMENEEIAPPENVESLRAALAEHYGNPAFEQCESMGELVSESLRTLSNNVRRRDEAAGSRVFDFK